MTSSLTAVRPNHANPLKPRPVYSPGRRSSAVTTHVTFRLGMHMNDSTPSFSYRSSKLTLSPSSAPELSSSLTNNVTTPNNHTK